ncbi:MAG TPA: iron-sulfur cluster assembly scaffold protein [Candidatus Aenigmarchaeota archaeon]|nr:iron-sulfur cluster assembly scaffold protein [Candidatus Aenigmarchaeota archaeon]
MVYRYSEIVKKYFKHPKNVGKIKNADAIATEGSVLCGDMMTMYLKIRNNKIVDAKFESFGCAANIATASMLTEVVKGMNVDEAEKVEWKDIVKKLGGLPPIKYHCSILAIQTLRSAIRGWKEKQKKFYNSNS